MVREGERKGESLFMVAKEIINALFLLGKFLSHFHLKFGMNFGLDSFLMNWLILETEVIGRSLPVHYTLALEK